MLVALIRRDLDRPSLAAHLDVNLLDLRGEEIADKLRDARLGNHQFTYRGHLRFHLLRSVLPVLLHALSQFDKVSLLLRQQVAGRDGAVAWADELRTEFLRGSEGANPLLGVSVPGVVVGAVHAGVAGEQDFFLRKPRETIAVGVRDAEYNLGDGAPVGDYSLCFYWEGNPKVVPFDNPDEPQLDPVAIKFNRKYGDPGRSEHKVTVEEGQSTDLGTLELVTR